MKKPPLNYPVRPLDPGLDKLWNELSDDQRHDIEERAGMYELANVQRPEAERRALEDIVRREYRRRRI